jgi:hypothetical protein
MMKYVLILFAFFACTNVSKKKQSSRAISTQALDTILSVPARVTAKPLIFETAFIKGTTQKVNDAVFTLYGVTIGKIKIPSGRIIACDPMHIDEYGIPFTQAFPTGEFPVQLSVAGYGNEELTAFARINFSEAPVAKWEFALQKGQEPIPVGGEKMHAYCVDAGVALFMDEEANKVFDKSKSEDMDAEVFKEMEKHYHDMWKYTIYNFGSHNLAAFSTGLGDGCYGTYVGYDAAGKPCRLVTDFGLFDGRKR